MTMSSKPRTIKGTQTFAPLPTKKFPGNPGSQALFRRNLKEQSLATQNQHQQHSVPVKAVAPQIYSSHAHHDHHQKSEHPATRRIGLANISNVPRVSEHKGVRIFRVWNSIHHGKKSLPGKVEVEEDDDMQQAFALNNIKTKSFDEWKKEAKLHLPSAGIGGAPVDNLEEFLHIAPTVHRSSFSVVVHNTLKRLSLEDEPIIPRKSRQDSFKRDRRGSRRSVDFTGKLEPRRSSRSSEHTVVEISTDQEQDTSIQEEEQDSDEEDDAEGQESEDDGVDIKIKLKLLRELPDHLSRKKITRQRIVLKATGQTVLDTEEIPLKDNFLFLVQHIHERLHDWLKSWDFWEASFAEINGQFGAAKLRYFIWLKRIVLLNILSFLTTLLVIIVPEVYYDLKGGNITSTFTNVTTDTNSTFSGLELITGEGAFSESYLYYSGYHHGIKETSNAFQNSDFRFLVCLGIIFLINGIFLISRLSQFYHGVRLERGFSGSGHTITVTSVICAWNFSCRDRVAASILQRSIRRDLQFLAKQKKGTEYFTFQAEQSQDRRFLIFLGKWLGDKWAPFAMHFISNLFLLIGCFTLGIILVHLCQFKLEYYLHCISKLDNGVHSNSHYSWVCPEGDRYLEPYVLSLPALFASITTLTLHMIIVRVGDMESWATPGRRVYATLIRAGLFYGTNVLVFYFFWISREKILLSAGFVPETIYGKELYRLVVIQGALDVIINLGVKKLYDVLHKNSPDYKRTEFRTEYSALQIFFLHALCGISTLFSPGLSLLITLRLVLDFYQHRYALFNLSSNDNYTSHFSSVHEPYLVMYCGNILLLLFMNIFYLSETTPTPFAGPFAAHKQYRDALNHISRAEGISWIENLLTTGFLVPFLCLLAALVYFCRQWAKSYEPIIGLLNDKLLLDRVDRDILLKTIFEVGRATIVGTEAETHPIPLFSTSRKRTWTSMKSFSHRLSIKRASSITSTSGSSISSSVASESNRIEQIQIIADEADKEKMEINRLMREVQGTGDALPKLSKAWKNPITVDTWNRLRHRREAMEKTVRKFMEERNLRRDAPFLAYDPTSRIFPRHEETIASTGTQGSILRKQAPVPAQRRQIPASALSKQAPLQRQPIPAPALNTDTPALSQQIPVPAQFKNAPSLGHRWSIVADAVLKLSAKSNKGFTLLKNATKSTHTLKGNAKVKPSSSSSSEEIKRK